LVVVGARSKALLLPKLLHGNLRLNAAEVAMNHFWQNLTATTSQGSFSWKVLVVVCLACVLACAFGAGIETFISIITLGCLTAIAKYVMDDRNAQ
jgi:hypothetical protein